MERSIIAVICDLIHPTLRGIFFRFNVECMQRAGVRGRSLIHRYCLCQRALNLQIALKPA